MNKIVMFFGTLLVAVLASGCQSLIALNPPKPKAEILCEEWKAEVENNKVQTEAK